MIARPSKASVLLKLSFQDRELATASGFIVKHNDCHFLITNWHVVTGRHAETGKPMHKMGSVPDRVTILYNKDGALGDPLPKVERLYAAESPLWREHPVHGHQVDVVALEIHDLNGVDLHTHDPWASSGVSIDVAQPVSIVGFPFGLRGGGLAIWVQGTIASEPTRDYDGLPRFLIDSRTRQGQSGSPVIAYYAGGVTTMGVGHLVLADNPIEQLLGVYSGRISPESDLGFVWKAEAVQAILASGVPGRAT